MNALIPRDKVAGVKFVIVEPIRARRTPEYLAEAFGAKVLVLPIMVGGAERAKTYVEFLDYIVAQITRAS